MQTILKDQTDVLERTVAVFLEDASGTPYTGSLSGFTITWRKHGGSDVDKTSVFTHIDSGRYEMALTAGDVDTVGLGYVRVQKDGAILLWDDPVMITAGDPALTALQAAILAKLPAALVGGRIDASVGAMASGVVTVTAIAADAITAAKIADGAIDSATFAAGAINAAAIADSAIDAATFAAGAINAAAIAADAITAAKIADGAIDAGAIADGAVTAAKLASSAITSAKIASGAITTTAFAAGAINAAAIATDAGVKLATALLDTAIDGTKTVRGALARLDAMIRGKATGLLSTIATFYAADGTTKRVEFTQDTSAGTRQTASTATGD